jgi:hypothetical protein
MMEAMNVTHAVLGQDFENENAERNLEGMP